MLRVGALRARAVARVGVVGPMRARGKASRWAERFQGEANLCASILGIVLPPPGPRNADRPSQRQALVLMQRRVRPTARPPTECPGGLPPARPPQGVGSAGPGEGGPL